VRQQEWVLVGIGFHINLQAVLVDRKWDSRADGNESPDTNSYGRNARRLASFRTKAADSGLIDLPPVFGPVIS
jgi:hypothetical protein